MGKKHKKIRKYVDKLENKAKIKQTYLEPLHQKSRHLTNKQLAYGIPGISLFFVLNGIMISASSYGTIYDFLFLGFLFIIIFEIYKIIGNIWTYNKQIPASTERFIIIFSIPVIYLICFFFLLAESPIKQSYLATALLYLFYTGSLGIALNIVKNRDEYSKIFKQIKQDTKDKMKPVSLVIGCIIGLVFIAYFFNALQSTAVYAYQMHGWILFVWITYFIIFDFIIINKLVAFADKKGVNNMKINKFKDLVKDISNGIGQSNLDTIINQIDSMPEYSE